MSGSLAILTSERATSRRGARQRSSVGAILLEALRESVGTDWTSEAERAWGSAYAVVTRAVLSPPIG